MQLNPLKLRRISEESEKENIEFERAVTERLVREEEARCEQIKLEKELEEKLSRERAARIKKIRHTTDRIIKAVYLASIKGEFRSENNCYAEIVTVIVQSFSDIGFEITVHESHITPISTLQTHVYNLTTLLKSEAMQRGGGGVINAIEKICDLNDLQDMLDLVSEFENVDDFQSKSDEHQLLVDVQSEVCSFVSLEPYPDIENPSDGRRLLSILDDIIEEIERIWVYLANFEGDSVKSAPVGDDSLPLQGGSMIPARKGLTISWESATWSDGTIPDSHHARIANWFAARTGQHFLENIERYVTNAARKAQCDILLELTPMTRNEKRWGPNDVFKVVCEQEPIGAFPALPSVLKRVFTAAGFKVAATANAANTYELNIAW